MSKDPLIVAGDRSLVGGVEESAHLFDVAASAGDVTYVEGYSDKRRHNALAQTEMGRQHGMKKVAVPYRLHWARTSTPSGKPDARDIVSHTMQGYEFVTKDRLADLGLQAPASGQLDTATGRYICGDTVLMYCTREVAARNENVLRRATEDRSSADATGAHLEKAGREVGRSLGQDMLTESTVQQKLSNRAVE
jgi:hypothetical protein